MAQQLTLPSSAILLYINNVKYNPTLGLSFTVDYMEREVRGIDSPWPQELASTGVSVTGSVNGIRTVQSGGLQGGNLRPAFTEIAASPYISIRITDRISGEDIILLQNAKVTNENHTVNAKGIYLLNFNFVAMIPLFSLDRI